MNGRARSSQPVHLPANLLIRHARSRGGRSREEVAQGAGLRESVVALYERGRRIPDWDRLQRILMACGFWLDVRLREIGPSRGPLWALRSSPGWPAARPEPAPSATAGIDIDTAMYLGHRLRLVHEELAVMASCLEVVAESFKHAEAFHYERFSRLVVVLAAPPLDQALASLERELRMVRSWRHHLRGSPHRRRALRVDVHACTRMADGIAHARGRLASAATRLRAERLDEMARAVEQQNRELDEIEQAFRICQEEVDAAG